jgi:hypothetical protein
MALPGSNQGCLTFLISTIFLVISTLIIIAKIILQTVIACALSMGVLLAWALEKILFTGRHFSFIRNVYYPYIFACENDQSAWYTSTNMHIGNMTKRLSTLQLCYKPCYAGYIDKNGSGMCRKQRSYIPSLCPHQMIFSMHNRKEGSYLQKSVTLFKDLVKGVIPNVVKDTEGFETYMDDINEYYNGCAKTSKKYDFVMRSVCSRIDMDYKNNKYDSIANMCANTYCGRRGNNGIACMKLNDIQPNILNTLKKTVLDKFSDRKLFEDNISKVLLVSTIMCVLVYGFMVFKKSKQTLP